MGDKLTPSPPLPGNVANAVVYLRVKEMWWKEDVSDEEGFAEKNLGSFKRLRNEFIKNSLVTNKRCVLKYRRNGLDGSGTWKEWKNIGYLVEYYIASSRARSAEKNKQRLGWTTKKNIWEQRNGTLELKQIW